MVVITIWVLVNYTYLGTSKLKLELKRAFKMRHVGTEQGVSF